MATKATLATPRFSSMDHHDWLLARLEHYHPIDAADEDCRTRLSRFVAETPACFSRHHAPGHVTASAWIVDEGHGSALLVHHRKLDRWLQPGGHVEDDTDTLSAARREIHEETGLDMVVVPEDRIFDLDIHDIPARGEEPAHLHYDVRFLFVARPEDTLRLSAESHDLRWFGFDEILRLGEGPSIDRMVAKSIMQRG